MKSRRFVTFLLMLMLLCFTGCSTVTFGYNHADWLLRYWVYGYTSFSTQQKRIIRQDIDDYLDWHRRQALPEYIAFLKKLDALLAQDGALRAADVAQARSDMGRLYRLTMMPAVRPAAHMLSSLNRDQIAEFRITLKRKNHEERKATLPGDERKNLDVRGEKYIGSVEDLAGGLSDEQKDRVRNMSLRIPLVTEAYIAQRENRQAELITLLESHAGEDRIAALLGEWVTSPVLPKSAQAQQAFETYDRSMNDMVARIWNMLTTRQKDHLRNKVSGYIDDLQRLHAEVRSANATRAPV